MQPLPGNIVRLSRRHQGIELYFPPLRNPGAALVLAAFGASCFIPGFFAALAVSPFADYGPGGMIAIVLMSAFILPFLAFGVLFVVLAVYDIANSLTVRITETEIRTQRRVLGFALRERRVATADIAAIEAVAGLRYRRPGQQVSWYRLVARTSRGAGLTMQEAHRTGRMDDYRNRALTVAESLRGETLMEQVKAEIVSAARLQRLDSDTQGNQPPMNADERR